MTKHQLPGFTALLLAAACATGGTGPTSTLVPQNGPKARITASWTGGVGDRVIHATFKVDTRAYVMVGHLGGDGRIRVLYPESPAHDARISATQTYAVGSTAAMYDAAPPMFSFVTRAYRSASARRDSYDGRGNGFVFLVASTRPLDFRTLSTDGGWNEPEVDDYASTADPRYAINDLALRITRGAPFTLDYADSFSTNAFTSYVSRRPDCSLLSVVFGGFLTGSASFWGLDAFLPPPTWHAALALQPYRDYQWFLYRPAAAFTDGHFGDGWCDPGYALVQTAVYLPAKRASTTPEPPPSTLPAKPLAPPAGRARAQGGASDDGSSGGGNEAALALIRSRHGGSIPVASPSQSPNRRYWPPSPSSDSPSELSRPPRTETFESVGWRSTTPSPSSAPAPSMEPLPSVSRASPAVAPPAPPPPPPPKPKDP